ncbi:MAG: ABC transporter substrate-binding protein [Tissierellales bacterium]|nr:ABC transporter substrate-binding protein [Tissierellales bacterium]MBN2827071.1 ABC transporter substrate-binding protein [Tissierellales bacterium]
MNKKLSVFLAIVLILSILAGCGNNNTTQNTPTQEPLDIAYYAYNSEPILNWDPSVMFSNGIIILNNTYETLLRFYPDTKEFEHVLATNYEKSEDGMVWTFQLRKGVTFHDGTPFTADAVKFSIERTLEIGQGASYIWDPVEEINVIDDYTVEFRLSYAAPLDQIASSPYAAFIMSPAIKDYPSDWFEAGNEAGTGPYSLENNSMGDEVILTKFNDYWKGWDGEHFDKIIIKKIPETSSRRQMVEKGEADITLQLTPEDIEALKNNDSVKIYVEPSFTNLIAFFNTEKAPLNDINVRQALSYAFPYKDVVDYAAGGYASQSIGAIPKGHWGRGENLFQYSLNLEKAKALLQESGIQQNELKLLLTYMSGDEAERKAAELYKAELSKIGVELEIRAMPWESQWEMAMDPLPENRQDIFIMYWWPDTSNPYSWLYSLFRTEESILFNMSYYSNENFDQLIDLGYEKSGIDIEEAENLFIEAQSILIDEAPAIFIMDKEDVWVTSSSFSGFKYNPSYPNVVFFYDTYRK